MIKFTTSYSINDSSTITLESVLNLDADTIWEEYKSKLNQFQNIRWSIEPLTTSTTFLGSRYLIKENRKQPPSKKR